MKKIREILISIFLKKITKVIDDIFLVSGVTFLSIGVFKIYEPAGYITLGICFLAGAYFYAQSR